MQDERRIAAHYAHGDLEQTILEALRAAGKDPERLQPADLSPVDEFHIGGRRATADFAAELGLQPGMHLLDIGCGIGGPSRYFAGEQDCTVTGIDLSEEYVAVAAALSRRVGLEGRTSYRQASALALPFAAGTFDGAYMLHVGMNIADKARLFAEARRVLRPGAIFGIYDVLRESADDFAYPVPWSAEPATNFIADAATYRGALAAAGFAIVKERRRREFAIEFFRQLRERMAESGPSPLGLQIVMGATAPQKVANMAALLDRGVIAPTELICRASG
ncbi:MAG: class I SAM-dependent methyltransferase [Alphaproteobacteria bacterium]|nr:class I SAM-dependent methyltransferase [Alphaproteobacteria bacterium]